MTSSNSEYDRRWAFALPHIMRGRFSGTTTFTGGPSDATFWQKGLLLKEMSIVMDINLGVLGEGLLTYNMLRAAINPPAGAEFALEKASFYGKVAGNLAVRDLLTDQRVVRDIADGSRRTAIHIVPSHGVRKHWVRDGSTLSPFAIKEFKTDTTRQRVTVCAIVHLRHMRPYNEADKRPVTATEWVEDGPPSSDSVDGWARRTCELQSMPAREHYLAGHLAGASEGIDCLSNEHCLALDRAVAAGYALPQSINTVFSDFSHTLKRIKDGLNSQGIDLDTDSTPTGRAMAAKLEELDTIVNNTLSMQNDRNPGGFGTDAKTMIKFDGEVWKVEVPGDRIPLIYVEHLPSNDPESSDEDEVSDEPSYCRLDQYC